MNTVFGLEQGPPMPTNFTTGSGPENSSARVAHLAVRWHPQFIGYRSRVESLNDVIDMRGPGPV